MSTNIAEIVGALAAHAHGSGLVVFADGNFIVIGVCIAFNAERWRILSTGSPSSNSTPPDAKMRLPLRITSSVPLLYTYFNKWGRDMLFLAITLFCMSPG